ncbi:hydrolase [Enterococcus lactis]|uniref:Hydrolase n=1 Tax=Enterococcus faecium TaxID=1352 RepID=A0AAI8LMU5_ENTFC|nr:hydrolase [Enterococcus faecium]PHL15851.1 hydrolase [Enterococcus faecium]RDG09923.1 hydrolase [Enterococcus faecium]RRG17054.1 hydrolase [Enterococcus faecium]TKB01463.1 hydrolase [Enterococcus lactis]
MRLNISVTTSPLNGVQKLASSVISPTKRKIGRTIFVWLFLLLDAGQLFHDLFFV